MLVGRERECARLQKLLDSGRSGSASVLEITGEAGVGKTALLDWMCDQAGGMNVLRAIGSDAEAELPFAALSDLLRPVLDHVGSIPKPQADALLAALTLGPAVFGDRFAIYAGVLSVLASAAEQTPVLIVVDDAGRIDVASAEAILFAARRLERDRVAVVVTTRVGESSPLQSAGLPELAIQGLELAAAVELLGPDVAHSVGAQLHASTGGNPLALLEIPGLLSGTQLSGDEPLPDPLPGGGVEEAFARQLERLEAASRRALLVAALADSCRRALVDRACAALAVPGGALDAAAPLAVTVEGVVRFRHPLLRDTVVQLASSSARRAAHRALAAALSGRGDADRRAWHLAAAARAPDEEAASALEEAALAARLRGGYGVSASAFERAARLTPDATDRIRRLHAAAADMQLVGRIEHAVETLDEVIASTPDPMLRADALLQRASADMWRGAPMQAYRALMEQATAIEPVDPGRAAAALVEAAVAAVMTWDVAAARVAAERANAIAPVTDARLSATAGLMLGHVLVLAGESRRGLDLIGGHVLALDDHDSATSAARLAAIAILPMIWLDRHERARGELEQLIAEARMLSAASVLPQLLGFQSGLDYRSGRWVAAYAAAGESVQLASETGQRSEVRTPSQAFRAWYQPQGSDPPGQTAGRSARSGS
jgi:tetratricopeptide (TPR) repeat protein